MRKTWKTGKANKRRHRWERTMEKSEENWLQVSWTSDAGCFAVVTHRLYSAPRNKFSGFLHTLHSAEGRHKEHNSSDECQGQSWHWAYSAHFKGFDCAFCHLYPAAPWLARGSVWEHGWQRKGLLTPQWPNRLLHKPTLLASLCLSWWHWTHRCWYRAQLYGFL